MISADGFAATKSATSFFVEGLVIELVKIRTFPPFANASESCFLTVPLNLDHVEGVPPISGALYLFSSYNERTEELTLALQNIIQKVGASTIKDLGKVMGVATKELSGKADGKTISTLLKNLLA